MDYKMLASCGYPRLRAKNCWRDCRRMHAKILFSTQSTQVTLLRSTGQFCPRGSSAPVDCDPGFYCDVDEMESPRGPCAAGFYCVSGAVTDQPSGSTGQICSRNKQDCKFGQKKLKATIGSNADHLFAGGRCSPGYFCGEGSWSEEACDAGLFQPSAGATNISWCLPCTAGKFCNSSGLENPQGDCQQGTSKQTFSFTKTKFCEEVSNMFFPPSLSSLSLSLSLARLCIYIILWLQEQDPF